MVIMMTYKYKFYNCKRNKYLNEQIDIAASVWNYCVSMYRGYYRLYGKTLSAYTLMKHITKVKKREKYVFWNQLGSQAIQDVVQRVDRSYKAFFTHVKAKRHGRKSPPHFCKHQNYKSFTLKQAGYCFHDGNHITINGRDYKYFASRPFEGIVKTITVKRTKSGDFYFTVVCQQKMEPVNPRTGNAVGFDFGLKQFLTADNGTGIKSPLWYTQSLKELRKAQRTVSRCQKDSNNRKRAILHLNKVYTRVSNQRRDWFYKLANQIVADNAVICIEDLNLDSMKRLWGRKVSDLSYAEFVSILEWIAFKNGSMVTKVDRWFPSSKTCCFCGYVNSELQLSDRHWNCPSCGAELDRDINAAINIKREGLAMLAS